MERKPMPKCAIGEKTAEVVVEIVRANPGRTSNDIAALTNEEISLSSRSGVSATLNSTSINSFLSYHPDGQALAAEGLVARERGKMAPAWADNNTPIAESNIKKAGELVQFVETGVTYIDQQHSTAIRTLNKIAKGLPHSRQRDVVSLGHLFNGNAQTIKLQSEAIDLLRAGARLPEPLQIGTAD
jgi:hypothetical protein